MTQLFAGIPAWVVVLFFALIYFGYTQTKTRKISRTRIIVLPVVMMSLSLYGVLHAPNHIALAILTWLAGVRIAFYLSAQLQHGRGVVLHPDTQHYVVPGSWVPLMLFMSVFIAKFTIGFLVGSHAVNPESFDFILVSSAVSGLISGTFGARATQIFQAGANSSAPLSIPAAT